MTCPRYFHVIFSLLEIKEIFETLIKKYIPRPKMIFETIL
jgi:hypothetical protein